MRTPEQIAFEYRTFVADAGGHCWRCGRTARDRPAHWFAAFGLERAHIDECNHPRRQDVRAVLVLCSVCHCLQHGHRFRWDTTGGGRFPLCTPEPLTLAEQLAIKKLVDPEHYDRAFLLTCMTGVYLPRAATRARVEKISWAVSKVLVAGL